MRSALVGIAVVLLLAACTSNQRTGGAPSAGALPKTISSAPRVVSSAPPAPASTAPTTTVSGTRPVAHVRPDKPAVSSAIGPPFPTVDPLTVPTVDPLTGGAPNAGPVLAVKIDNTFFEVAQFGIADADVVYVEQVEGGLTRLIAIFHTTMPTEVGPVRSVRSTDAQLLPAFGRPGLVFAGGAGGPMTALAATPIVDTSLLAAAYFRSSVARGSYNLHADLTKVVATAHDLSPARYVGFDFAPGSPLVAAGRPVSSLQVVMQAGGVAFAYRSGRFVRTRGGSEVSDYQGRPEVADNVLVQRVVETPDGTVDTLGAPSYLSSTVGSGTVSLFRNGHEIAGTWKRAKPTDPFTYAAADGRPLPFAPGRTWVALAPQSAQLIVG